MDDETKRAVIKAVAKVTFCNPMNADDPANKQWEDFTRRAVNAFLRAAEGLPVPHKLVGREAIEAMIKATWDKNGVTLYDHWESMFDAAPGVGDE